MWLLGRTLAQLEGEALSSNPEPEEKLEVGQNINRSSF